ncbi:hypothetical protein EYF80_055419 [Liparis tanakae]|uniref:Uncharacterized protein n=1 Tax=Liparis tanakae TaxID=230148 RepID=A0A4Z2EZX3_9TELE|nr:hypothetical protein EYF80_055419 [Liparis tanakae]
MRQKKRYFTWTELSRRNLKPQLLHCVRISSSHTITIRQTLPWYPSTRPIRSAPAGKGGDLPLARRAALTAPPPRLHSIVAEKRRRLKRDASRLDGGEKD